MKNELRPHTNQRETLLTVRGLEKRFHGSDRALLDGIDLDVHAGELIGLIGTNGCGKTTLLSTLAGIQPFEKGTIEIAGLPVDPRRAEFRTRLGYVPDEYPIRLKLTTLEYLQLSASMHGLEGREREQRVEEQLATYRLEEFANVYLEVCSHGVTKRVATAAALLHSPPLLLLDEPESGLDGFSFTTFTRELQQRKEQGGAALIATHNLDWAREVCDSIVQLDQGRIVPAKDDQPQLAEQTA